MNEMKMSSRNQSRIATIIAVAAIMLVIGMAIGSVTLPLSRTDTTTSTQFPRTETETQTVVVMKTTTQFFVSTTTNYGDITILKNMTSALQFIFSVVGIVVNSSFNLLAINQTISIPYNTTQFFLTNTNGYYGTLYVVFQNGCMTRGGEVQKGLDGQNVTVFLEPYGTNYVSFDLNFTPFSVSFQNNGTTNTTCGFSLIYVWPRQGHVS